MVSMHISDQIYSFRIIIEPDKPTGYHGFVPLLSGVHTFGGTVDEVRLNLKEAIICHLQGMLKDNEDIPREEDVFEFVQTFSKQEFE